MPEQAHGDGLLAVRHARDARQVGPHGEHEGLAGHADGGDLADGGALGAAVEDVAQLQQAARAEGAGAGVVVAVVEGDQRHGPDAAGELDVALERVGDDLVVEGCQQVGVGHRCCSCGSVDGR